LELLAFFFLKKCKKKGKKKSSKRMMTLRGFPQSLRGLKRGKLKKLVKKTQKLLTVKDSGPDLEAGGANCLTYIFI
jgi:hypothetical protein